MDKKPIYKQFPFWLAVAGAVLIAIAIVGYLITDWNPLLLIILGGVGILLIVVGLLFSFNKKKSYLELTPSDLLSNRIRRKVIVNIPELGRKASGATVKGGRKIADLTLSASTIANEKLTSASQKFEKIQRKVKIIAMQIILSALLSVSGVGNVLIAGELGSVLTPVLGQVGISSSGVVGSTVVSGLNVGGQALGQVVGAGGSTLGSVAGSAGSALTSLGGTAGSTALTTLGTNLGSAVGSTAGQVGLNAVELIGKEGVSYGLGKLSGENKE